MTKLEQKQKELIDYSFGFVKYIPYVIDLMNEITELEKQAITEADIKAWAKEGIYGDKTHKYAWLQGRIEGVKAALNGEIKHIEK